MTEAQLPQGFLEFALAPVVTFNQDVGRYARLPRANQAFAIAEQAFDELPDDRPTREQ